MNDKTKQALELALEALEDVDGIDTETECVTIDVGDAITAIKEALAEPKQYDSMELHVTHSIVAGVLYDFMGWLTTRRTRLVLSDKDNASPAVDAIVDFAKMRGLMLEDAQVEHWQKVLVAPPKAEQPAQQQEQKLEFVSPGGGYVPAIPKPIPLDWKLVPRKATPEMLKAMDECAQEGYDERLYAGMASSVYMAAWDASPVMGTLPEQPAQQQEPYGWKVYGVNSLFMGEFAEADAKAEAKRIGRTCIAFPLYTSPPASKPLTDEEIEDEWERITGHSIFGGDRSELRAMYISPDEVVEFARAIEAAHGITGEQK